MKPSEQADLKKVIHQTMDAVGSKEVAADLQKPYWTLMHEIDGIVVDVEKPTHKLWINTLIGILDITGNPLPFLTWINRRYGFLAVRQPRSPAGDSALHEQMSRAVREFGDVANALLKYTDPASKGGRALAPDELVGFERECQEAMTALATLMELARKAARPANVTPIRRGAHE